MHRIFYIDIVFLMIAFAFLAFPQTTISAEAQAIDNMLAFDLKDLMDTLDAVQGGGQQTAPQQEKKPAKQTDQKEPSRLQRRLELLEGVGTLLSSTGEIDYESERKIGESLALEGFRRYGLPLENEPLQRYVNLIGTAVARNSLRPGIPYRFVVVDSPLQNAFSCPGGIIFICAGLFQSLRTEAQLACLLAHEVAHVGHKHALQSIKRARFFQGVGKITAASLKGEKGKEYESMIGDLQTVLFDKGLDQNMEFEADFTAMETAYRTGYGPNGMVEILRKLQEIEARSDKAGSWFSTHPPVSQRIAKTEQELKKYQDWKNMAQLRDRFTRYGNK